jgi:hypothetical protein
MRITLTDKGCVLEIIPPRKPQGAIFGMFSIVAD